MSMQKLPKLKKGDKVAILSPSFAAPGVWPHVYELGLQRLRDIFGLVPIEYPTTKKVGATGEERLADLIKAFEDKEIKGVITSLGGDDQVTYIKNLPGQVFHDNPKPFFGFSDNTHFQNFLWLNQVPSYYGGAILTQFAMQGRMDELTIKYLKLAMFEEGEFELDSSPVYNDMELPWNDPSKLVENRIYQENDSWYWDGAQEAKGISWGGCLESIDEILRHGVQLPSLEDFENVVLILETSEEIPTVDYVRRVMRAFGHRGILERVKGLLVGRAKAYYFTHKNTVEEKKVYRQQLREVMISEFRKFNQHAPIVQNLDFGHTDPQIALPYGGNIRIDGKNKKIFATF